MKIRLLKLSLAVYLLVCIMQAFAVPQSANAQYFPKPGDTVPGTSGSTVFEPPACTSGQGAVDPAKRSGSYCPDLRTADPLAKDTNLPYPCAKSYAEWVAHPNLNFWVEDPTVTSLGKGGERSRQFLLWALTRQSIDDHPVILDVWKLSQNVALFLILIVVIIMGIGIVVGQRGIGVMGSSFNMNIEITPLIIRIAMLLLFIVFSARIVLIIIQLSDVLMEFFIRTLGVRDLFNIFFLEKAGAAKNVAESLKNSEQAYREFVGCTNWNIGNQEMVTTSKAMVRFTNMTYYFLGGMLLLRKIVLWFLIMLAPFLALLAPFVFIRNVGWMWVGVFFQWVFYGPLMALFLGGLANIWNSAPVHIPYVFDFSRVHRMGEVVYPTSINILYGGPAQKLGIFNTSNYVDTFVEYIIGLMMLWTVIILPWFLLRIFRDYCCDGIYAMKNVLMAMYDTMRGPNPTPPGPTPTPTGTGRTALDVSQNIKTPVEVTVKLETMRDIKQAQTQQIVQAISMEAHSLRDVARMETNKESRVKVTESLNQIQNPFKAETPTERQRLMNIRNEVQTRASQGDKVAQRVVAVTAKTSVHERVAREQIIASMPRIAVPTTVASSSQVKVVLPASKINTVVHSALSNVSANQLFAQQVSEKTGIPAVQTAHVLQTMSRLTSLDTSTDDAVSRTAQEVGLEEARVKQVIAETARLLRDRPDLVEIVARQENVDVHVVADAVQAELRGASGVTQATHAILRNFFMHVALDSQARQAISQEAKMSEPVIVQIFKELSEADTSQLSSRELIVRTAERVKAPEASVRKVLESTSVIMAKQPAVVEKVAQTEHTDIATVKDVSQEQLKALSTAEKDIEDYVPQTKKVSIEDYEEVKSMWIEHYESGEIPETENVRSREDWVAQDTIRISNILNKLMSSNKTMQEQGLAEVGYILPIFMVNNLSGEELLVYLKAKIQAAKETARSLEKEKELREKIKTEDEETLVEVEKPHEEEKAMQMGGNGEAGGQALTLDMPVPEDAKPVEASERGEVSEPAQTSEPVETKSTDAPDPLSSIKSRLAEEGI